MNSNTFRLAALAVAAAPVALLVAVPAQAATAIVPATPDTAHGKASAVVLRTGLDVSLLNKAVDVPLKVTLNEVHAPASAEKSALSVKLDGVDQGQPVEVLQADVATAEATADAHKAEGRANLVKARVHVPGLPRLSLIEVEEVTSKALCETGKKPVAESNVLGHVSVLGKRISLSSGGTTNIEVPGVGSVTLDLSKTSTTTRTAAATALQLRVSVNPLKLNVAEVEGEVTLAEATCETPKGGGSGNGGSGNGGSENGGSGNGGSENGGSGNGGSENGGSGNGGSENGGSGNGGATGGDDGSGHEGGTGGDGSGKGEGISDVKPQTGTDKAQASGTGDLAETGSSSSTPYIAGGAAVLLAAGAGATVIARRRSTQN